MSTQKTLLSGIGSMAVLTVSSKVVRLVVLMITARYLTPVDFGVVAAFSMVLAFAYLFANNGVVKTLIQRPIINNAHIGSALLLSGISSSLIILALLFASHSIALLTGVPNIQQPLQLASLLFILLAASNICMALFQRSGNVVFIGKVQAFATIFGSFFITVPLLWFDIGYWAIVAGIFATELTSIIIIIWQGKSLLHFSIAKREFSEVIKYSAVFLLHNVINLVAKQIDIAIIGRYLGITELGHYTRATQLIEFPNQIYWLVVDRVIFPSMSAMKSDRKKLCHFFVDAFSILLLLLTVGTLALYFGANELIKILMGDGWGTVAILVQILSVNIVIKCMTSFIDSFLAAYGTIKLLTYKNIIALITFIAIVLLAINWGLKGVAYGVVIASVINLLMSLLIILYAVKIPCIALLYGGAPALFSLSFIFFFYFLISFSLVFSGLLKILIAIFIWGIFCFILPRPIFLSLPGVLFINNLKHKGMCGGR